MLLDLALKLPKNRLTNALIHRMLDGVSGPVKTRRGYSIVFKRTGDAATNVRKAAISGSFENEDFAMFETMIREGDILMDIGAHEGLVTLWLSKLVGSQGRVYAVEPNPENLKYLRENVELNQATNVTVVPEAISAEVGKAQFFCNPDGGAWGSLQSFWGNKNTVDVSVTTVDEVLKGGRIDFLKIDTEGHELNVLKGAERAIVEHHPTICFEVSLSYWASMTGSVDTLFDHLRSRNYELFALKGFHLEPYRWLDERVCNFFAIHQPKVAEWIRRGVIVTPNAQR